MSTRELRMRWVGVLVALYACGPSTHGTTAEARAPATQRGAAPAPTLANTAHSPQVVLLAPGREPVAVRVEIARDEAQRRRGLMFRTQLDPDAGMLFLFERPQQLSFWMRNTEIPLDMIFIEPSMRVLGIVENAEPHTDTSRSVPGISQYVLEVNAGFSRRYGLGPGTAVRFEGIAAER
jgi:uncharacterized membrane protein (UPF0127 family)